MKLAESIEADNEQAMSRKVTWESKDKSIRHEADGVGRHRIVVGDVVGPWASYSAPAVLDKYVAFTPYHPSLPAEEVMEMRKVA